MSTELATAYLSLVPSMRNAQGNIATALAPAVAEGDRAGAATGNRFMAAMGTPLGKVGALMAGAFAFDKLKDGVVALYGVGETFDDVADTIRVGTGASGEALDGLVDIAKEVGTSVPTSFEAAGSTVADLNTRLGLSGDTLSTVAQQYIQAGNILGEAVDIEKTTAAFNAFHIEGAAVEGAMDSLFQVSQATGVGINDLASTVQTAAAPLQNLGFDFEEVAGLAGTLGKAGINTNQVVASMSKGLVTLAKDGEEPAAAFQRVTSEIGDFISAGDTASALDLASEVFGTRGASQFVGALQSGVLNMEDLANVAGRTGDTILGLGTETADAAESWQLIKNKGVAALEPIGTLLFNTVGSGLAFVAANMDGPIQGAQRLADGIGGVADILFRGDFSGPIFGLEEDSGLVDFLFNLRDGAAQLWDNIGPLVGQLFDLWTTISPLGIVFQSMAPYLPLLAAMFGQLAGVLGGALGGILAQVIPLVSELAAVVVEVLSGVLMIALPVVANLLLLVGSVLASVWPIVGQVLAVILSLATTLLMQLAPVLMSLVSTLLPPLATLFGVVITAILPLVVMLAEMLIPVLNALMPVVMTVFSVIVSVIQAAMDIVLGIIQVVTGILTGDWSMVWDGIVNILSGAWNLIVAAVTGAVQIVWSVIQAAIQIISAIWTTGWAMVGSLLASALGGIVSMVSSGFGAVWNTATSIFNNVVGFVAGIPGRIMAGLVFLARLGMEAAGWFGGVLNSGRDKLGELVGFVGGIPGRILSALGNVGSLLYSAGRDLVNGMINGIRDMVGNLASTAANMAKSALDAAKNFLGIKSPSRKARFELGQEFGEGAALGLEDKYGRVEDAMAKLIQLPRVPEFASSAAVTAYAEASSHPAYSAAPGGASVPPLTIEGDVYGATPREIVDEINTTWTRGSVTHNLRGIGALVG